jgi:hypothetical protein
MVRVDPTEKKYTTPTKKKTATTKRTTTYENFYEAFAAAQVELEDPIKNSLNPHFKSEYVDLGTLMACVRPVLARHGLTICTTISPEFKHTVEWVPSEAEGVLQEARTKTESQEHIGHRITAEIHGYGKCITSSILVPPQKNVQAFASFHTYARRWLIGGLCGVAEAKDDDGNVAAEKDPKQEILSRARR